MVTIQRTAATMLCVALLAHVLCFPAYGAVSNVNFKFVDPAAAGTDDTKQDSSAGSSSGGTAKTDESTTSGTDAASGDAPAASAGNNDAASDTQTSSDEAANKETPDATKGGGVENGKLGVADQNPSDNGTANEAAAGSEAAKTGEAQSQDGSGKILQGYVRVVPSGTKVPIIMDTAIDSDTSQEGDEFSARTSEDLDIDGSTVVPAGSTIRGRVAQLNLPRRMDRSGSVALKFDTITTPDNRQIPLVANLVAHGGVVHARRGIKDIAIDTSAVAVPTLAGLGIGLIAAKASSSSSIGAGGGALIGAGLGVAVGVGILLAKKGKKVDVRPGDELKIELAEDLRMPM